MERRERTNHHTVSIEGLTPIFITVIIATFIISMMAGLVTGIIAGYKVAAAEDIQAVGDADDTNPVVHTERPTDAADEPKIEPSSEPIYEDIAEPRMYFELTAAERKIVEKIVMGEAGGESYKGKVLVAQCILNACIKDDIQPSEVRRKYQYSGWKENPNDDVKKAVAAVFDDGYKVTDEPILYFYAPKYTQSKWHETQRYILTEGGHKFFAEWNI